jgi:tetratricopeptide (TPR) repeat protein
VATAVAASATPADAAGADCSVTGRASSQQAYGSALQLAQAQPPRWSDALVFLREAVRACPAHVEAVGLLAQALYHTLEFQECNALCARLVADHHGGELSGVDPAVLRVWGLASARQSDWGTARMALAACLAQAPADTAVLRPLAQVTLAAGDDRAAAPLLRTLHDLGDPDGRTARELGDLYRRLGQHEAAAAWYDTAATKGATAAGWFELGVAHLERGEFDAATQTLRRYVGSAPESAPGWRNLGIAERGRGNPAGAIEAFTRSLELDPLQHAIAVDLARLLLEGEQFGPAEALARRAIAGWDAADTQLPGMYCVLGKVLEKRDQAYEQAIAWFEKAVQDSTWGAFAARELERQRALLERRAAPGGQ